MAMLRFIEADVIDAEALREYRTRVVHPEVAEALDMHFVLYVTGLMDRLCTAVERDDVAAAQALRPELAAVDEMSAVVYGARRLGLSDALSGDGITPYVRAFVAAWRRANPFAEAAAAARARLFASRTPRARRRARTAAAVRLDSGPTSKLTAPRPVRVTPTPSL
jgi:hypothetical protein